MRAHRRGTPHPAEPTSSRTGTGRRHRCRTARPATNVGVGDGSGFSRTDRYRYLSRRADEPGATRLSRNPLGVTYGPEIARNGLATVGDGGVLRRPQTPASVAERHWLLLPDFYRTCWYALVRAGSTRMGRNYLKRRGLWNSCSTREGFQRSNQLAGLMSPDRGGSAGDMKDGVPQS